MHWFQFFGQVPSVDTVVKGTEQYGSIYLALVAVAVLAAACAWLARALIAEKDKRIAAGEAHGKEKQDLEREHGDKVEALLSAHMQSYAGIKSSIDSLTSMVERGQKPHS